MARIAAPARVFAAASLAAALGPLDTMVNPAFPAITAAFALELAQIQWIPITYLLAFGSLALVSGRLGDLYGHRRVCLAGLAVCAVAFAACAAASSYPGLLAARVLQGIGIALLLGGAPPIALAAYPESERTAVLARFGAVLAFVMAASPAAGGLLVEAFGWRAVFAARVPLALVAILLIAGLGKASTPRAHGTFDGVGALLLATWLAAGVLALALPPSAAWMAGLLGIAGLAAFVAHQSRAASPILRPAMFLDARFAVFNLASLGVHFVGFAMFLLGPYFFARVTGLSTLAGGLLLTCGPLGAVLGSMVAESLVRRHGTGRVAFATAALVAASVGGAAAWDAQSTPGAIGALLFVQGAAIGLYQVAYTDYVVGSLSPAERGVAASLANLTRTLGIVTAASLLSALFRAVEAQAVAGGADASAAFLAGYRASVGWASAGLAAFLLCTLARPSLWATGASR